jgi:hypothetical protein
MPFCAAKRPDEMAFAKLPPFGRETAAANCSRP